MKIKNKILIKENKPKSCYEVEYVTVQWYQEMFYDNRQVFKDESEMLDFLNVLNKYKNTTLSEKQVIYHNFWKDIDLYGDVYYYKVYYYDSNGNKYYCEIE